MAFQDCGITRAPSEQFSAVSRTGARNEMESGRLCALQRVVGGPQSKKMTNTSRRLQSRTTVCRISAIRPWPAEEWRAREFSVPSMGDG